MPNPILLPVVALVLWSLVMEVWLYATRIPAIQAAKMPMDPTLTAADLAARLPPQVRWKADNYNHLMEQPTIFYAVCLAAAVGGVGAGLNAWLAWGYVALRVVHSLVQAIANPIMVRFSIFMLSSIVLAALTVRAALAVL